MSTAGNSGKQLAEPLHFPQISELGVDPCTDQQFEEGFPEPGSFLFLKWIYLLSV